MYESKNIQLPRTANDTSFCLFEDVGGIKGSGHWLENINRQIFNKLNSKGIKTHYLPDENGKISIVKSTTSYRLLFSVFKGADDYIIDLLNLSDRTGTPFQIGGMSWYYKQITPRKFQEDLLVIVKHFNGMDFELINDDIITGYFLDHITLGRLKTKSKEIFTIIREMSADLNLIVNTVDLEFGYDNAKGNTMLIGDLTPIYKIRTTKNSLKYTDTDIINYISDNSPLKQLTTKDQENA